MTTESEARERASRIKCFLELIVLPDEALLDEFPELFGPPKAPPPLTSIPEVKGSALDCRSGAT